MLLSVKCWFRQMWWKLNTLDDSSDRLCVPNKTKDENVKVV